MKVKTPSSSKVSKQAVLVGSAIPGAMLSKGVAGYVPGGNVGKLAFAVAAAVAAASITGTGTGSDAAKGALAGMAIQQGVEAVSELVQPVVDGYVNGGEPSKLKEFVAKTTGLAAGYPTNYEPGYYIEPQQEQEQLGSPIELAHLVPIGM